MLFGAAKACYTYMQQEEAEQAHQFILALLRLILHCTEAGQLLMSLCLWVNT